MFCFQAFYLVRGAAGAPVQERRGCWSTSRRWAQGVLWLKRKILFDAFCLTNPAYLVAVWRNYSHEHT
jgi:hypothetical protein